MVWHNGVPSEQIFFTSPQGYFDGGLMLETGTRPTRFQVVFEVERCEKPKRNILDILGIGVQCIRDSDALRMFSLQPLNAFPHYRLPLNAFLFERFLP